MENDRSFRHELKYLINKRDMDCCVALLKNFASADPHAKDGGYFVRSLYFDDPAGSAYMEKEDGVRSRHKYRIRTYDMDSGFICLEKKIKEGSFVKKESALLTEAEYRDIMAGRGDALLRHSESVAKDFATECRIRCLRPEVIVDYDRLPFVYEPGNVRITFDMNVRAVIDSCDIMKADAPEYEVLGRDLLIMEVKYTQFLPDIFRAILPNESCRLAMSKYCLCYDKKHGF